MSKSFAALFFAFIFFVSPTNVRADVVVYDNNAGGAGGISHASKSDVDGNFISGEDDPLIIADNVNLSSTTIITGVEWTGIYFLGDNIPPVTDTFTISIYGDATGVPTGAPLASFAVGNAVNRTDSGFNHGNIDIYDFSASISFTMNASTNYWVSIYNNTPSDNDNFFQGILINQGNSHGSNDTGSTWNPRGHRTDFRLTTAVPEPSSLLVLGLASMTMLKRRRLVPE